MVDTERNCDTVHGDGDGDVVRHGQDGSLFSFLLILVLLTDWIFET
jgi:hypothetical protein